MWTAAIIAGAAATLGGFFGPSPAPKPPRVTVSWAPNLTWVGPMLRAKGRVLESASATWTAPAFPAQGAANAEMAYWVGLGGTGKPMNLCQAGIAATRTPAGIQESLIAQDYPQPFQAAVGVHPGDKIMAFAGLEGGAYTATVTDETTGQSLSVACAAPRGGGWAHAEWIAESNVMQTPSQPPLRGANVAFAQMAVTEARTAALDWTMWGVAYQVYGRMGDGAAAEAKAVLAGDGEATILAP